MLIDAFGLGANGRVPRSRDGDALPDGGGSSTNTPGSDDSHGDEGGDSELLRDEDTQVKQDGGNLVERHYDGVEYLAEVEAPKSYADLLRSEVVYVHAIAVDNGEKHKCGIKSSKALEK